SDRNPRLSHSIGGALHSRIAAVDEKAAPQASGLAVTALEAGAAVGTVPEVLLGIRIRREGRHGAAMYGAAPRKASDGAGGVPLRPRGGSLLGADAQLVVYRAHARDRARRHRRREPLVLVLHRAGEAGDRVLHVDVDVGTVQVVPILQLPVYLALELIVRGRHVLLLALRHDLQLVHDPGDAAHLPGVRFRGGLGRRRGHGA